MYALVSLVPNGMDKLRELFESHVHEQGLSVLEKCKDTAINVSATRILELEYETTCACQHQRHQFHIQSLAVHKKHKLCITGYCVFVY